MRDYRRYLRDPYYWRRALVRVVETVTRRTHVETLLDQLLRDNWYLADPSSADSPGTGIRLLYVAPKFDYGNPARGYSYEENHFLPALTSLGFQVIRLDSLSVVGAFGRRVASQLLTELAFRFSPQVAFFVLFQDDFEEGAIEDLTRQGCICLNWFTDDHWRFESFSRRWASKFTWVTTTDPLALTKYHAHGIHNVIRSQWGVNHRLYRPLGQTRRYNVTFIGQPHGDRRAVLKQLENAGVHVECWGYGWPRGKISTRQAVEIINESALNLDLSKAIAGGVDQIKGRDFEVPACRGLLLTGHAPGLDEYLTPGTEVLTYGNIDDLLDKVRWALDRPSEAEQVRDAGYHRVLREHTYEKRFSDIFRAIGVFS